MVDLTEQVINAISHQTRQLKKVEFQGPDR